MPSLPSTARRARTLACAGITCCSFAAALPPAASAELDGPVVAPALVHRRDIPRQIVRIADGEFRKGIRETPPGSNNSREIARYRAALRPRPSGGAWCAYFASWVARQAGAPIGRHGSGIAGAAGVAAWARSTGRWRRAPRPGDLAVYGGHVGIVVAVRGSAMTTIEGNWSDRVSRLSRSRRDAFGFARVANVGHLTGR